MMQCDISERISMYPGLEKESSVKNSNLAKPEGDIDIDASIEKLIKNYHSDEQDCNSLYDRKLVIFLTKHREQITSAQGLKIISTIIALPVKGQVDRAHQILTSCKVVLVLLHNFRDAPRFIKTILVKIDSVRHEILRILGERYIKKFDHTLRVLTALKAEFRVSIEGIPELYNDKEIIGLLDNLNE